MNMYMLLWKVFYNGRIAKIFYTIIFPQIRRYHQEPGNVA